MYLNFCWIPRDSKDMFKQVYQYIIKWHLWPVYCNLIKLQVWLVSIAQFLEQWFFLMLHKHDKDTKDLFFFPLWPLNFHENVMRISCLTTPAQPLSVLPNKGQIFRILCFSWACSNHKSVIRNHVHIKTFVFIVFWTKYKQAYLKW